MKETGLKAFDGARAIEPLDEWPHKKLWRGIRTALKALPAYFRSETFIEGINATDIFTLNSALGATIENQVVESLNMIRNVWDPDNMYGTYAFRRQPQSFPDVVLKNLSDEAAAPVMGIELKGWYLLAKEGEPSMRFTQTEAACADSDLIMVVPWTLGSVISGRPRIFTPFIESAKFVARYRNAHWKAVRGDDEDGIIEIPETAAPYPRKSDATTDYPRSDRGGNFGRIARSGIMDDYLKLMMAQTVCGIKARYWLEFFKIFHQDSTDAQIHAALARLRGKADSVMESADRKKLLEVILAFETLADSVH